ncbi:MAG: shikimate kinase, partial [Sulfobacillus sp.]
MQPREHSNDTNIVIIGFMGVGKTTIGSLLAQKLNREFFDVDKLIEMEFGRTIPEIFELWGEQSFREKERDIILTLCRQRNKVIALGGGAFIQEDIRNYCLKQCSVFLLDLSWEEWKTNRLT